VKCKGRKHFGQKIKEDIRSCIKEMIPEIKSML
jgi:hypothetical protein